MREKRNKGDEPYNFPSSLLWGIFTGHASKRGNAGRVQWFPEWKRQIWESGRLEQLGFSGKSPGEKRAIHREFWRSADGLPEMLSWGMISVYVWGNYPKSGKEPPKRIRDKSARPSHRAGSHQASRFVECWLKSGKGPCLSSGGWLALKEAHFWFWLSNLKSRSQHNQIVSKQLYCIPEQSSRIILGYKNIGHTKR